MSGATAEGVDWADADIPDLVDKAMRGLSVGNAGRDDPSPVDVLARAWQKLDGHKAERDAISKAVADFARSGTVEQKAYAMQFFSQCPMAAGGKVFAEIAKAGASGYASTTKNPSNGVLGDTMREALLYAAVSWNDGSAADAGLMKLLKDDVMSRDGKRLMSAVAAQDSAWFLKNVDSILALYPDNVGAVWRALVKGGDDPVAAAKRVLKNADKDGRYSLSAFVRTSSGVDRATKDKVLALLK